MCLAAAERLADHGIGVTVVDPRWVKPVDEAMVGAARRHRLVAVVEDNGRVGGFGDAVSPAAARRTMSTSRSRRSGCRRSSSRTATAGEVLAEAGLTPQHLARADHRGGGAPRTLTSPLRIIRRTGGGADADGAARASEAVHDNASHSGCGDLG